MQNPWLTLPPVAPYVLEEDRAAIEAHQAGAAEATRLRLELFPEPFLGRPDAPVLLLPSNPGFSDQDTAFHQSDAAFIERSRRNLRHENVDYPFYLLDPQVAGSPGYGWWASKLKLPIQQFGLETVARHVACVELFPYHSRRYPHKLQVSSQAYSFYLVRAAIERGALIIVMRAVKRWLQAVPELASYSRCYGLNSPQNVTISPKNCPAGYPELVTILKEASG